MPHRIRNDRLTVSSRVMDDLMLGAGLSHNPGEVMGTVASRVALEVVVEITDWVDWTRTQYRDLDQRYMTDFAYLVETW